VDCKRASVQCVVALLGWWASISASSAQALCFWCQGDFCVDSSSGAAGCRWLCPNGSGKHCYTAFLPFTFAGIQRRVGSYCEEAAVAKLKRASTPFGGSASALRVGYMASDAQPRTDSSQQPRTVGACRDVTSSDGRSMRLCGSVPNEDETFQFSVRESDLIQIAEVSPGFAQAVLALRSFSQHGGLERAMETQVTVNTNPSRAQTLHMIRGNALTAEESLAVNAGGREAFGLRTRTSEDGSQVDIEIRSLRGDGRRLTLNLLRAKDSQRSFTLHKWQFL